MTPTPALPCGAAGPTIGEKLLLSAIRDWATPGTAGERPNRRVAQALAFRTSNRVAGLFLAWMLSVEASLRRPIQIECPVCGGVSTDEQRLLVSCGLAGTASDLGEELLAPLLLDAQPVMVLARALNAALRAEGYPLPVRLRDRPLEHVAQRPTVH